MENKNLEKKEKISIGKIIVKIFFILMAVSITVGGALMALCGGMMLNDSWLKEIAIWIFFLGGIILFILGIYLSKNINKILKKLFSKKNKKNDLL